MQRQGRQLAALAAEAAVPSGLAARRYRMRQQQVRAAKVGLRLRQANTRANLVWLSLPACPPCAAWLVVAADALLVCVLLICAATMHRS